MFAVRSAKLWGGQVPVGFGPWFSALPAILKILVILGIVVGAFGVGASLVVSTLRGWALLSELLSHRGKSDHHDPGAQA